MSNAFNGNVSEGTTKIVNEGAKFLLGAGSDIASSAFGGMLSQGASSAGGMGDNVLNQYRNVTYHFTFGINNEMAAAQGSLEGGIIIAESGVTSQYTIDAVSVDSYVSPQQINRNVFTTGLQIKITEGGGSSLVSRIGAAAGQLGIREAGGVGATFVLQLRFMGYSTDGQAQPSVAQSLAWSLSVTDIKVDISEAGTSYTVEAIPHEQIGLRPLDMNLNSASNHSVTTIGEFFQQLGQHMTEMATNKYSRERHTYSFNLMPLPVQGDIAPVSNPDISSWLLNSFEMNGQQARQIDPATGFAGMLKYFASNFDKERIENIVLNAFVSTEEGQQVIGRTSDGAKPSNQGTHAIAFMVRCQTSYSPSLYDDEYQTYNYSHTYNVIPYLYGGAIASKEQAADANNPAKSAQKIAVKQQLGLLQKEYNYMFTGLNTEVLELNVSYSTNGFFPVYNSAFGTEVYEMPGPKVNPIIEGLQLNSLLHINRNQLFPSIFGQIQSAVTSFPLFSSITSKFSGLESIASGLTNISSALSSINTNLVSQVSSLAQSATSQLNGLIDSGLSTINSTISQVGGGLVGSFTSSFSPALSNVLGTLGGGTVNTLLGGATSQLSSVARNFITGPLGQVQGQLNSFIGNVQGQLNNVSGLLNSSSSLISNIANFNPVGILGAVSGFSSSLSGLGSGFGSGGGSATSSSKKYLEDMSASSFQFPIKFEVDASLNMGEYGAGVEPTINATGRDVASLITQQMLRDVGAFLNMEVKIKGDPFWLPDGGAPYYLGSNNIFIKFRFPNDSDVSQRTRIASESAFTGLYIVERVQSEFSQGSFTQTLYCLKDGNVNAISVSGAGGGLGGLAGALSSFGSIANITGGLLSSAGGVGAAVSTASNVAGAVSEVANSPLSNININGRINDAWNAFSNANGTLNTATNSSNPKLYEELIKIR